VGSIVSFSDSDPVATAAVAVEEAVAFPIRPAATESSYSIREGVGALEEAMMDDADGGGGLSCCCCCCCCRRAEVAGRGGIAGDAVKSAVAAVDGGAAELIVDVVVVSTASEACEVVVVTATAAAAVPTTAAVPKAAAAPSCCDDIGRVPVAAGAVEEKGFAATFLSPSSEERLLCVCRAASVAADVESDAPLESEEELVSSNGRVVTSANPPVARPGEAFSEESPPSSSSSGDAMRCNR
jgi:hypothetical protein